MEYVFVATKVLGAVNTLQQASAQSSMYKVQAEQAKLEASRKALQYEQRANDTLKKLRESQSAVVARGFASGIIGTQGSPGLVASVNEKVAGEEFIRDLSNASDATTFGQVQSNLLMSASKTAYTSGLLSSAATLGEAAYSYSKIGKAPTETPKG